MGTDIHTLYQKQREDKSWEEVELDDQYDFYRNYVWFAILADVRNGYGFAGVERHTPLEPISEPRGIPPDMADYDGECSSVWLGDHSFSWLMLSEILEYFKTERKITHTGIIGRGTYLEWGGVTGPHSYSGGVGGPGVLVFDATQFKPDHTLPPEYTHVKIKWTSTLLEDVGHYVNLIKDAMETHGDLRMVFGFDS